MSNDTHAVLARIDGEVAALERRIEDLRIAKKVLLELDRSDDNVPPAPARPKAIAGSGQPTQPTAQLDLRGSDLSLPDAAKQVLRTVGKPMKAREIGEYLVAAGFPTSVNEDMNKMRNNVAGTLDRAIRKYKDEEVEKVGPGTYGLTVWQTGDLWHKQ